MSKVTIDLDKDLAAVLQQIHQPVEQAVRELMVLELYRRGSISSGKAAELLGMARLAFLQHASHLGIPFFDMTEDEWAAEQASLKDL
jgi:predicted HTH domain antitoxin